MAQLDQLLKKMVKADASDLHLSCGEPIRMRIHGELRKVTDKPLEKGQLLDLMKEICRKEQWSKFLQSNELDFAYGIKGLSRFRCNYLSQVRGPGAIFRVIPEEILPLEALNVPEAVEELTKVTRGLVLVTGPTGSGKSTTLASIINRINKTVSRHIITIEDPVEFVHTNIKSYIVQREVGVHSPDFTRALKDALLQDPDVILVGEMRDLETISLAITAAEMGVLVFGTLHTNSAAKTIDRIVDAFPPMQKDQIRGMLAESLRAVVAQQLLKRWDIKGRIAAVEILLDGPGLSNIIRDGNVAKLISYMEGGKGRGMKIMDDSLFKLVHNQQVKPEDAFLKSNDKHRFEQMLNDEQIFLQDH